MFRIGEFSKIAQVSGRLLRYYDQFGLLSPVRTDPQTGYRYYSAAQLPRLNRILALKDLGLALEQIRELLNEDLTADKLRGMLVLKRAQTEQDLAEQAARLRSIEGRIQQIDGESHGPELDVVIKSVPAHQFLSVRTTQPTVSCVLGLISDIRQAAQAHSAELAAATLGAVLHSESFEVEHIDVEVGFLLTQPVREGLLLPSGERMSSRALPGCATAATAVAVGGPNGCVQGYCAIGKWIEAHDYRITGLGREVFLVAPQGNRVEEMVLEIQFPIDKASS